MLVFKNVLKQTSNTYKKVNTKKSIVEYSTSHIFASVESPIKAIFIEYIIDLLHKTLKRYY